MIQVADIRKRFDSLEVLRGVSLTVGNSEVVAIVGPSGAGKTTLLQIMGSLERPDGGSVTYVDSSGPTNIFDLSPRRLAEFRNRRIGFVFQLHNLLPEFTLEENVALAARNRRAECPADSREFGYSPSCGQLAAAAGGPEMVFAGGSWPLAPVAAFPPPPDAPGGCNCFFGISN